jgi:UDP-glucose 4-epimerase
MNVLVTGGAGFIGTNLIKRLISEGHKVTSVDNYSTGLKTNHVLDVKYINQDISFRFIDWSVYDNFDVVYHMAGIARIQPSFEKPMDYFKTNANGTMHIAEFCVRKNIPLIYAGSSSHHSGKNKNPYTFSKDIGEEIIGLYKEHYNLKSTIVRFYNVYGPHQIKDGKYSTIIGRWEHLIENKQPLTIYGDGNKRRDFTHIDDVVDGLMRICNKEKWGYTFELGRGRNHSINEIADMFNHEKIYLDDMPGEAESILCDATAANIHLGWYPKLDIEDYIKNYLSK